MQLQCGNSKYNGALKNLQPMILPLYWYIILLLWAECPHFQRFFNDFLVAQVLVIQDMLGMNNGFRPRFLRRYADLYTVMTDAISRYVSDVKNCYFPNEKEQY